MVLQGITLDIEAGEKVGVKNTNVLEYIPPSPLIFLFYNFTAFSLVTF